MFECFYMIYTVLQLDYSYLICFGRLSTLEHVISYLLHRLLLHIYAKI